MRRKIGVSSCLLGNHTRYDGGHRLDPLIAGTLQGLFDYVAVCPEVECGLPVPRPVMQLTGAPESPRLVTVHTGIDHTDRMRDWAAKKVRGLEAVGLCGFIFKSGSPSCGIERVRVYAADGTVRTTGAGLFARAFAQHFPLLLVTDECHLQDAWSRQDFLRRLASGQSRS